MSKQGRKYVWINTDWLNEYWFGSMTGGEFRKWFNDYVSNPENIHYEVQPVRREFQRLRKVIITEIYERDPNVCAYCGSTKNLEIDHIVPIVKGGTNDLDNLQILCRKCNRKKWGK